MACEFAPTLLPNAAAVWRSAIEDLSPHASPCRYLTPARWVPLREAAINFCERLGAEAHAFGWTAAELFAVHPEAQDATGRVLRRADSLRQQGDGGGADPDRV